MISYREKLKRNINEQLSVEVGGVGGGGLPGGRATEIGLKEMALLHTRSQVQIKLTE